MKYCSIIFVLFLRECVCREGDEHNLTIDDVARSGPDQLESEFPLPGDLPVLNRKIVRGTRVSILEHPYVASIRRLTAHYLTGTILTTTIVITVAHPLVDVPVHELGIVYGENYNDRGTTYSTVILIIQHNDFDRFTLNADVALLRTYEVLTYKAAVKPVRRMFSEAIRLGDLKLSSHTAFVTGWGRCDVTGLELCLPRSTIYYPDEVSDPMLRTVTFLIGEGSRYCELYQKRHEVWVGAGMLCLGVARQEHHASPCMAVPGAPLVVDGRLLAILSWGYGCGYNSDLPLVYTDMRSYYKWYTHVVEKLSRIDSSNYTTLFHATRAAILNQWLNKTRKTKTDHVHEDPEIQPWGMDRYLATIEGAVYDIRDYMQNSQYRTEKDRMYEVIRAMVQVSDEHKPTERETTTKNYYEQVYLEDIDDTDDTDTTDDTEDDYYTTSGESSGSSDEEVVVPAE